jgi:hypothetical protein
MVIEMGLMAEVPYQNRIGAIRYNIERSSVLERGANPTLVRRHSFRSRQASGLMHHFRIGLRGRAPLAAG